MLYNMIIARREVLVQLDVGLVAELDALASRLATNRSELLRRGARAVLAAARESDADRAMVDAYRRVPQDPAVVESVRRLGAKASPDW